MKILVTGSSGLLGHDVMDELIKRGHIAFGKTSRTMDITDAEICKRTILSIAPDGVIHCAAWTDVDGADIPENHDKVYAVNIQGTKNVAEACQYLNCKMLYLSTDYVFDGSGDTPWSSEFSKANPLNVYGVTKLQGEHIVESCVNKYFIVRTSWLFGSHGDNFISAILNYTRQYKKIRVVDDQIGTPTYTADLARLLVDMIESNKYGLYHAVNEGGFVSRYDLARFVFKYVGIPIEVLPVSTEEFGKPIAQRPKNSRLDTTYLTKMGFSPLQGWRDALSHYLNNIIH